VACGCAQVLHALVQFAWWRETSTWNIVGFGSTMLLSLMAVRSIVAAARENDEAK
jgi:hypothetical protein